MMIGHEGKTKTPVFDHYNRAGFDPTRDLLQSYGDGWRSGQFLPQERQFFGIPGGAVNDWELKTNLEGLFAAGDMLFASDCVGHAAATGHYAGRHAADFAARSGPVTVDARQLDAERTRIDEPLTKEGGPSWQATNLAITRVMQNYCGAVKSDDLLHEGLKALREWMPRRPRSSQRATRASVSSPRGPQFCTNAELVMQSCLARKASSTQLQFTRLDYPEMDPPAWHKWVTIRRDDDGVHISSLPIDFWGDLTDNYERHAGSYVQERHS